MNLFGIFAGGLSALILRLVSSSFLLFSPLPSLSALSFLTLFTSVYSALFFLVHIHVYVHVSSLESAPSCISVHFGDVYRVTPADFGTNQFISVI